MTLHNALKYSPYLQSGIEVAAGMSQDAEGVVRLGETITPSMDPWSLPEWAFLRAERLGAGRIFVPAVVAESSIAALGNAAGSNSIVVVEAISFKAGAALDVNVEIVADTVAAATLGAPAFYVSGRDRRFGSTQGRVFTRSGTDPATTLGVQLERQNAAATLFTDCRCLPIVLKPGDDVILIGQAANITIDVNWKWRERLAFNGELPA